METGSYALAFAVASTGGWNTTVKSMKRCSCIEVIPISAGSMSPRTVLTLPFMRLALLVLESNLPRECILYVGPSQYEWDFCCPSLRYPVTRETLDFYPHLT